MKIHEIEEAIDARDSWHLRDVRLKNNNVRYAIATETGGCGVIFDEQGKAWLCPQYDVDDDSLPIIKGTIDNVPALLYKGVEAIRHEEHDIKTD